MTRSGEPWAPDEVAVVLDAYLEMLGWQLDGREFVKAEIRQQVEPRLPARSKKSIELKWCNISAVLDEMGLSWVHGYRPLPNYQRSLVEAVEGQLRLDPDLRRKLQA